MVHSYFLCLVTVCLTGESKACGQARNQWPENYFELLGSWQGGPLKRPIQGDYENRTGFE
jgi:hypothetical protein